MRERLKGKWVENIIKTGNFLFSGLILLAIIALFLYTGFTVYGMFVNAFDRYRDEINIVHNIAYIVVLIKAYKILIYYFKEQHLSIKYLVQISIIAPAIEVIFAADAQSLGLNMLFAAYSLTNLLIYIRYRNELNRLKY